MKRNGTATANGGNVAQKSVVTRWFVNWGNSGWPFGAAIKRRAVGQTNIYSAATSGAKIRRRERKGRGFSPILFSSQVQKSCRATMWQPQPQTKRPRMSVASIATAKKINPALIKPFRSVYIVSDGSMGEIVRPAMRH